MGPPEELHVEAASEDDELRQGFGARDSLKVPGEAAVLALPHPVSVRPPLGVALAALALALALVRGLAC
eukprot:11247793-Alexandrium_andersonii.AAC.1